MLLEEDVICYGVLYFMWLEFLWELYLSIRQHKVYRNTETVPVELQAVMDEATYQRARIYGLDINTFKIGVDLISVYVTTMMILSDGLLFFWRVGESIVAKFGYGSDNEILESAAFVLVMDIFSGLVNLPFSAYSTFVLEEKYGFNKQSFEFFIKEQIMSFVTVAISLIMATVYSNYIVPRSDKYIPLPDGNLKTRIEELANSTGFPLYKVYVVRGSRRSGHSSAYLFGFFNNKHIVLYDTLLRDYTPEDQSATSFDEDRGCDDDEVLAILSHELGHWKLNHALKGIVIGLVNIIVIFLIFNLLHNYEPIYYAFGFYRKQPVLIGLLIVFNFIILPYMVILDFLLNLLSRHFEFEADAFAKTLGKSEYLKSALIKLHKDNLIYPVYDWLYSMWYHSHPPLLERLRALDDKED